jgi:hypothetical protein
VSHCTLLNPWMIQKLTRNRGVSSETDPTAEAAPPTQRCGAGGVGHVLAGPVTFPLHRCIRRRSRPNSDIRLTLLGSHGRRLGATCHRMRQYAPAPATGGRRRSGVTGCYRPPRRPDSRAGTSPSAGPRCRG